MKGSESIFIRKMEDVKMKNIKRKLVLVSSMLLAMLLFAGCGGMNYEKQLADS